MPLTPVFFALVGLILGSFGNVVILRIRHGETLRGRSHCPRCKKNISWFDLFPVCSFLILRGHCRHCKKSISIQYPLVEIASMGAFLLGWFLSPVDLLHASALSVLLYLVLLTCVYDGMYQQIPDLFTELIVITTLFDLWFSGSFTLLRIFTHLEGALIPFLWFGIQWLLTRGRAVGTGDIFFGTALGLWLGFPEATVMLVLSYMVGALIILLLLGVKKISWKQHRIAFGPFLGLGTVLTILGLGNVYISLLS